MIVPNLMSSLYQNTRRILVTVLCILPLVANGQGKGEFTGDLIVRFLSSSNDDDRDLELVEDFGYLDASGFSWEVPSGTVVNGASIPRFFWRVIGPPLVGDYRRASVVHDHYCDAKSEPWQAVHRMFYEAMLTDGVSDVKAKIMYAGVYSGGPRWKDPRRLGATLKPAPELSDQDFDELIDWVQQENPSIYDIENRIDLTP